jgi:hypothetical protein
VESITGPIWECAAGRGAIVRALREAGHEVIGTDLVDYGSPDSRGDVDFLKQQSAPDGVRTIITNPPYMRAGEFVRHALELVPHVVMLTRLAFLESQRRSDILDDGRLAAKRRRARSRPFWSAWTMMIGCERRWCFTAQRLADGQGGDSNPKT